MLYIAIGDEVPISVPPSFFTLSVAPKASAYEIVIAGRDAILLTLHTCGVPIPLPVGARTFVTSKISLVVFSHVAAPVPLPQTSCVANSIVVCVVPVGEG